MIGTALAALAGTAEAQLYPGEDVVVNPGAIPRTPGFGPPIKLHRPHRPVHHRTVAKATAPADTATASTENVAPPAPPVDTAPAPADTPPPPPPPPPKPAKAKHTAAAVQKTAAQETNSGIETMPLAFGSDQPLGTPVGKVAKAEPPPPASFNKPEATGDLKLAGDPIVFDHNATDPPASSIEGIKKLATDSLESSSIQIELHAYAGAPNDKSSDARRLALKRALAVRQILIDNGMPAARIIPRALGGATDNGKPDRVDIYIRGG